MATQRYKPIVLVVDDERALTDDLVIIFNHMGFTGRTAYSFSGAILLLDEERPDLVITVDVMNDGHGTALCNEIRCRKETAAVPIIMIGDKFLAGALRAGADVVLRKPASPKTLIEWTKKLLANYEDFKQALRRGADRLASKIA